MASKQHGPWREIATREVYRNPWIRLREDQVIRPDGRPGIYSVVEIEPAVGVVALTADERVYLVGQYRYPTECYSWEIVSGYSSKGEDPLAAAQRELREETGLTATDWTPLGDCQISNSVTNQVGRIFLARELVEGVSEPDETETLAVKAVPLAEALQLAQASAITQTFSLVGLYRAWHRLHTEPPVGTPPSLSDGVVVLDSYTLSDVDAHLAGEDEEQARRFGWYPAVSTRQTVETAIRHWQESWRTGGTTRTFAVRDAVSRALVGGCEIRLKDDEIAHMSYWIFPPHRRRGLASRAVRLACGFAFAVLGVGRMELYVEPDNLASRRVARKAGFTEEGVLRAQARFGAERRAMVLYARLPDDPIHPLPTP